MDYREREKIENNIINQLNSIPKEDALQVLSSVILDGFENFRMISDLIEFDEDLPFNSDLIDEWLYDDGDSGEIPLNLLLKLLEDTINKDYMLQGKLSFETYNPIEQVEDEEILKHVRKFLEGMRVGFRLD